MAIRRKTLALLAVAALAIGGGMYLANRYVADLAARLLSWTDTRTGARVELINPGSFDSTLVLRVTRDGRQREEYVIDKSSYGLLSFVLYNDRLLALNDRYIFAAYDLPTDRILKTEDLPFTLHDGQGRTVASAEVGERAVMRNDFPLKADPNRKVTTAPVFRFDPKGK